MVSVVSPPFDKWRVHGANAAGNISYRVGDLSPDISIIGQLYYTIKKPFYLEFCIKRLVVIVNLVYKISA